MNRGVVQSSPVQQMTAAGNPNWWNISASAARSPPSSHQFPPPLPNSNFQLFQAPQTYQYSNSNFALSSPPTPCNWDLENDNSNGNHSHQDQITSASWSQLFLSTGLVGDEEKTLINHFPEHQQAVEEHIKQENSSCGFVYANNEDNFQICNKPNNTTTTCWSPQSCITTTAAASKPDPPPAMVDRNSECNSAGIVHGGAAKKAKVQSCATQSTFKVRKFGDRITALHQLVSPFGKTDTASVLLEAIGYIRFLQGQIEALSLPHMGSGSGNNKRKQHPQSFKGEKNCIFPEDPGQLLHDNSLKRKGRPDQEEEAGKDLRSRGLCLVPVSCTLHVGRDNGADYWAPVLGGFR